jgi:hypothetical protein
MNDTYSSLLVELEEMRELFGVLKEIGAERLSELSEMLKSRDLVDAAHIRLTMTGVE